MTSIGSDDVVFQPAFWALNKNSQILIGACAHMLQPRQRLTADPTVSVADLCGPLETYMDQERENNVFKVLEPPTQASWKSGCPTGWLSGLADLFKAYVIVAPNTVVSAKKHRQAMLRLLETKKWGHSKKNEDDAADMMDDWIRMGLSHLRVLKQHPDKKEQAFRKCDKAQRQALDHILALINVDVGSQLALCNADGDSQQSAEAAPSPSPPHTTSNQGSQPMNPKSVSMDFNAIFDGVLQASDEDEIKITYLKKPSSTGASSSKAIQGPESPSPQKKPIFRLHMTEEEKQLMQSAAEAEPIARDGKSQNQRINAIAPKPKKNAKGKKKKNVEKKTEGKKKKTEGKEQKTEGKEKKTNEDAGEQSTRAPMKRPSAAPQTLGLGDEEDEEKLKERIPEGIVVAALNLTKDLDPAEVSREVRRQRTTSNAYHRSEVLLMRQGMCKEDAQAVGRVAGRLAGAEFDKLCPSAKAKAAAKSKSRPKASAKSKPKAKTSTLKKKKPKENKTKKTKKSNEEEMSTQEIKENEVLEETAMNSKKGVDID